jgi:starch synthase
MLASENGALPHGKVGGMGDVTRDLPRAITGAGHHVSVMTPAYGIFANLPGARKRGALAVPFAGVVEQVDWYSLPEDSYGVRHEVLDHARFAPHGAGHIYWDDGSEAPFFTDASKFAFFSSAAATAALEFVPDVVHLHDWHLGPYLAFRSFDRRCSALRNIRTVFTIHNLALQGIRPQSGSPSSWAAWFPKLRTSKTAIADPNYSDCVNPMAMGIRLADSVNTVSPTYAKEIVRPNDAESGFHGGEGLEAELKVAERDGRLCGILNGCDYDLPEMKRTSWTQLLKLASLTIPEWIAASPMVASANFLAEKRLAEFPRRRPRSVLTSIGRVTAQKASLFREPVEACSSALQCILNGLEDDECFIMLGTGESEFEQFFVELAQANSNFLFLRGYSDAIAQALYTSGDLFLMPSSFEPCGISQMLAMRAGQLCVAHSVGGLKDTVTTKNGFPFAGSTARQQAQNFTSAVARALDLRRSQAEKWQSMSRAAAAERFDWNASAQQYLDSVYGFGAS